MITYGSVCSGIEAATVAWHSLGWKPSFFSEIEKFPRAVLKHHYPNVPLHGDFTTIQDGEYDPIDLLVGGTPCQDYSVAGLREGLDGERGNLTLEFSKLSKRLGVSWFVWENVLGVFSTNGGRDFAAILATFAGYPQGYQFKVPQGGWRNSGIVPAANSSGYGLAWRVLDAQYFGVPQRRKRVFIIGYTGDWRCAAAVLFERESLRRDITPSREAGEGVAATLEASAGRSRGAGTPHGMIAPTLDARAGRSGENSFNTSGGLVAAFETGPSGSRYTDISPTLDARCKDGPIRNQLGVGVIQSFVPDVAACLESTCNDYSRSDGFNMVAQKRLDKASEIIPILEAGARSNKPVPINTQLGLRGPETSNSVREGLGIGQPGDPMFTLQAAHQHAVAYRVAGDGAVYEEGSLTAPLTTGTDKSASIVAAFKAGQGAKAGGIGYDEYVSPTLTSVESGTQLAPALLQKMAVRRLIAKECERLQGFPDDYTRIPDAGSGGWRDVDEGEDVEELREIGLPVKLQGNVWRVKDPDGPRYKALGNSMAVPVMKWIGHRIELVEKIIKKFRSAGGAA